MSLYLRVFRYFQQFLWQTLFSLFLMSLGVALNLLKPWPFKYIVDGILPATVVAGNSSQLFLAHWLGWASRAEQIVILSAALVIITLLASGVTLLSNILLIRIGLKGTLQLRRDLYACLQSLPLKYHDARRSSDSSYRVAYDSQSIQTMYNKGFSTIFTEAVTLVAAFTLMVRMDWALTLVSFVVLPVVMLGIRFYSERIRRASTSIQERESDLLATTQEGLSSVRMIRAFGRESFEIGQFLRAATQSLEANFKMNLTSTQSSLVVGTLMALGTSLMYATGAFQVLHGKLTLGDLLVFASYLTMLYTPIEQLTYTAWALEGAAAGAQRCFEILDEREETEEHPDALTLERVTGEISFSNVSFSYTPAKSVLKKIDLIISPGETVAFVGSTGTGKSTLLSLIPRFYDPCEGRVCLDGHDLRDVTKASLRAQIGMVFQETLLFSSTIRENIAYGREGATDAEIIEAARRAQAYDFIMAMPHGFETSVGERGGHLSVGQRQRIGIARAFLKNAPILLLDEPTSALDPATEKEIMETILELMKGRTTLIVTHRIATIHRLQHIVVLDQGAIAQQGSGESLLAADGVYARLHRAME
jgi:ATP-binding cassette subfamily B protein/subfamily B ATP-binding cassette protein MsbA